MKKLGVMLIAVVFMMGISVASYAVEKKKGDMGGKMASSGKACDGEQSHMSMFKKLGLDEKQKEAIHAIHLKTRKEMIKKEADIKVAKIELTEILSKDPVDIGVAEAAVKKIEGLRTEKKMLHIKAMEEIKSNLNAEQRKEFSSMMKFRSMKKHNKGHMRQGRSMEEKKGHAGK